MTCHSKFGFTKIWSKDHLLQENFGPRTILSCKKWSYHAYFGPILGLIVAARNGPKIDRYHSGAR